MEYDKDKPFPNKASVECDWGDGVVFAEDLENIVEEGDNTGFLRYKITHAYEINGEYNVTCK